MSPILSLPVNKNQHCRSADDSLPTIWQLTYGSIFNLAPNRRHVPTP